MSSSNETVKLGMNGDNIVIIKILGNTPVSKEAIERIKLNIKAILPKMNIVIYCEYQIESSNNEYETI